MSISLSQEFEAVETPGRKTSAESLSITLASDEPGLSIGSDYQTSPLGRLRMTTGTIIFDTEFKYGVLSKNFITKVVGSATQTADVNKCYILLNTTSGATDRYVCQSRYYKYYAGCSYIWAVGCIFGTTPANCEKRVGFFDDNNGLIVRHTSSGFAVGIRTKTSGTVDDSTIFYAQADWNIDPMNGNGPSGINLSSANLNVFCCDFTWQGVGTVRFGILNDGKYYFFHKILNYNNRTVPYMQSATLPMRFEIRNVGSSTASTMYVNGISLTSESKIADSNRGEFSFTKSMGTTKKAVAGSLVPLLSIRPKTTFNSVVNRIIIDPQMIDISTSSQLIQVQIILNPTLTNASFSSVSTQSGVEADTAATVISGGTVLYEFYVAANSKTSVNSKDLELLQTIGLDVDGVVQDTLTVAAISTAGGSDTFVSFTWIEEH